MLAGLAGVSKLRFYRKNYRPAGFTYPPGLMTRTGLSTRRLQEVNDFKV